MYRKPHFYKGRFYNDQHDSILFRLKNMLKCFWVIGKKRFLAGDHKKIKSHALSIQEQWLTEPQFAQKTTAPTVTWLGHATFLIQLDGMNILTDPVFDEISSLAPRLIQFPINPAKLPKIDVVLISHNHRDHVDEYSLQILKNHNPKVCVPLGNKQWFQKRGFNDVVEMTWWDDISLQSGSHAPLKFTCLPAEHWTSRGLFDINKSLWSSWMISSADTNIYFAGDTAYADHFKFIGKAFSSIDIALLPIGPNEPREFQYEAHTSAEEAVQAFLDLDARHFIPMHWGTFMFGIDSFLTPIQRLLAHWKQQEQALTQRQLWIGKIGQQWSFDKQIVEVAQELQNQSDILKADRP